MAKPKRGNSKKKLVTGGDPEAPSEEEWNLMTKYHKFVVSADPGDGRESTEHPFQIGDTVSVLPSPDVVPPELAEQGFGIEDGYPLPMNYMWIGVVKDIRVRSGKGSRRNVVDARGVLHRDGEESAEAWVQVQWFYSKQDLAAVVERFDAAQFGENERALSDHQDLVHSSTLNDVVPMKRFHFDPTYSDNTFDQSDIRISSAIMVRDDYPDSYYRYDFEVKTHRLTPIPTQYSCFTTKASRPKVPTGKTKSRATLTNSKLPSLSTPLRPFSPSPLSDSAASTPRVCISHPAYAPPDSDHAQAAATKAVQLVKEARKVLREGITSRTPTKPSRMASTLDTTPTPIPLRPSTRASTSTFTSASQMNGGASFTTPTRRSVRSTTTGPTAGASTSTPGPSPKKRARTNTTNASTSTSSTAARILSLLQQLVALEDSLAMHVCPRRGCAIPPALGSELRAQPKRKVTGNRKGKGKEKECEDSNSSEVQGQGRGRAWHRACLLASASASGSSVDLNLDSDGSDSDLNSEFDESLFAQHIPPLANSARNSNFTPPTFVEIDSLWRGMSATQRRAVVRSIRLLSVKPPANTDSNGHVNSNSDASSGRRESGGAAGASDDARLDQNGEELYEFPILSELDEDHGDDDTPDGVPGGQVGSESASRATRGRGGGRRGRLSGASDQDEIEIEQELLHDEAEESSTTLGKRRRSRRLSRFSNGHSAPTSGSGSMVNDDRNRSVEDTTDAMDVDSTTPEPSSRNLQSKTNIRAKGKGKAHANADDDMDIVPLSRSARGEDEDDLDTDDPAIPKIMHTLALLNAPALICLASQPLVRGGIAPLKFPSLPSSLPSSSSSLSSFASLSALLQSSSKQSHSSPSISAQFGHIISTSITGNVSAVCRARNLIYDAFDKAANSVSEHRNTVSGQKTRFSEIPVPLASIPPDWHHHIVEMDGREWLFEIYSKANSKSAPRAGPTSNGNGIGPSEAEGSRKSKISTGAAERSIVSNVHNLLLRWLLRRNDTLKCPSCGGDV